MAEGTRTLQRDARTGYLLSLFDALGVAPESQLLVFSKTGVQRAYTGPRTPRALYFTDAIPAAVLAQLVPHLQPESPRALFELALPMSMRPRGRAPAMLVLGTERDALFTPAHIAASAARFDLTPVMLPHLSHMFMLEPGWESAAAHLADWLDAQLAPGNPA